MSGRDDDARLAVRHVLSVLRLDGAAGDRILRSMATEDLRTLAKDALSLHDAAQEYLRWRR